MTGRLDGKGKNKTNNVRVKARGPERRGRTLNEK